LSPRGIGWDGTLLSPLLGSVLFPSCRLGRFKIWCDVTSVADPWHFDTDPDPRIRTSDCRIRIQEHHWVFQLRSLSSIIDHCYLGDPECTVRYWISNFKDHIFPRIELGTKWQEV
jgi:hypothetical protein